MKKLYNFSLLYLFLAIFVYAFLYTMLGMIYLETHRPFYGIAFILIFISGLFMTWYFLLMPVRLEEDGVHHGDKFIPRENLRYRIYYDDLFKEDAMDLTDKTLNYTFIDASAKKKRTIRIQATKANLRKLGDYVGETLYAPIHPPKRGFLKK